jgi:putative flippase GtrA
MKKLIKSTLKRDFVRFFIVGGISTIVDWIVFYLLAFLALSHYQLALVVGFSCGAITNYSLNKTYTFKSKTKKIASQFTIFILFATGALILSIGLMYLFIDLLIIHKMISRIITTGIIFVINYFVHKNITFNKKYFT